VLDEGDDEDVVYEVDEFVAEIVKEEELKPLPGPPAGGPIGATVLTVLDESSVVVADRGWNICRRGNRCHQWSSKVSVKKLSLGNVSPSDPSSPPLADANARLDRAAIESSDASAATMPLLFRRRLSGTRSQ
jgi:hypothetical protein